MTTKATDDLPYMTLWVADALAELADLDDAERGAYLSLMIGCWKDGGSLPLDSKRLARRAGTDPAQWEARWGVIQRFFEVDGGSIRHPAVTAEMTRARKALEDRRRIAAETNAKRAAKRDAERDAERDGHRNDDRNAGPDASYPHPHPDPHPDPQPEPEPEPEPEREGTLAPNGNGQSFDHNGDPEKTDTEAFEACLRHRKDRYPGGEMPSRDRDQLRRLIKEHPAEKPWIARAYANYLQTNRAKQRDGHPIKYLVEDFENLIAYAKSPPKPPVPDVRVGHFRAPGPEHVYPRGEIKL
jgi:uncharacterized protein YdaU (DUF1376 family)